MTTDSAVAVVTRDFAEAWWLLAEGGDHERHDADGLRWFHTGADDPHLNPVLETRLADDAADAAIDAMLAELRGRGAPFMWWHTPRSRPTDLGKRLLDRGLVQEPPWPGMTLDAMALLEPPPVVGLVIRSVTDDAEYDIYERIFAPILSPSPAFTEILGAAARRIGYADDAPEAHFVGHVDGEPVATASLVTAGGAAGIYNITTVESARRRGIGAAMTAALVRAGAERGLNVATLQASTMGRHVYERLGFEFACDLVPYRSP